MTWAKRWCGVGLLIIGGIAVGLLLSEVGLRLFYPQQLGVWHHDRDGLVLHWPGLVTSLPDSDFEVSFNSVGMRDREHSVPKPDGVFRLLLLGDSFMEALQVPFERSFPSLVEQELSRRVSKRVEVINASVSGWGTGEELKYLGHYGMEWNADLILVAMTLHNDISDNLREEFYTARNGVLLERPRPRQTRLAYEILRLKGFLSTRSHSYRLLMRARRAGEVRGAARELRSHIVELFRATPTEEILRGLELTARLLERMQTLASSEGSRVVVALVPLEMQMSNERFAEFVRLASEVAPGDFELERPQRLMMNVGDRLGIAVIDLLPGFREWTRRAGRPLYLEGDGHWNEWGHRLAAGLVARALVDRRFVPGEYAGSATTSPR